MDPKNTKVAGAGTPSGSYCGSNPKLVVPARDGNGDLYPTVYVHPDYIAYVVREGGQLEAHNTAREWLPLSHQQVLGFLRSVGLGDVADEIEGAKGGKK